MQTHGLPPSLPEVQALVADHSPQAIAQLGTTLWYRYHNFDGWAAVAFDSIIRLLGQVPVHAVALFLREINDRLATGLESQIGKWMSSQSAQALVGTFGGPLNQDVVALLGELVDDGVLSAVGAMSLVAAPAWRSLLSEALSSTALGSKPFGTSNAPQLQALDTIVAFFAPLVTDQESHASSSDNLLPSTLARQQRALSRRAALYTQSSLPDLAHCISLLVIQQDLYGLTAQEERARTIGALTMQVINGPAFQVAASRDPQALATAMLDSPFVLGIPAIATYRPKLLAAVLLALKDGTTGGCDFERVRLFHALTRSLQQHRRVLFRPKIGTCSCPL